MNGQLQFSADPLSAMVAIPKKGAIVIVATGNQSVWNGGPRQRSTVA